MNAGIQTGITTANFSDTFDTTPTTPSSLITPISFLTPSRIPLFRVM